MSGGAGSQVTATARRQGGGYAHSVRIRGHELTVDEPAELGGGDTGPAPQELLAASLATCTAITLEMYAARKGWELGELEVLCDYTGGQGDEPADFELVLRLPPELDDEQVARLLVIARKCPVHRALEGEIRFRERAERRRPDAT